jgi:hypothetical protein
LAYYRLVSVALDGSTKTSELVFVEQVLAQAVEISAFPNPSTDVLNVQLDLEATIQFIDLLGRVVVEQVKQDGGVQFQTVSMPKGIYFIRTIAGATSESRQVVLK